MVVDTEGEGQGKGKASAGGKPLPCFRVLIYIC